MEPRTVLIPFCDQVPSFNFIHKTYPQSRLLDIRTLFILVLLSFLDTNAASQTKTMLLERHRDTFLAVFKGIAQDHYSLARKVLEACWAGIWSDNKLSRTLKVGLFNETTIGHVRGVCSIRIYVLTSG